MNKISIIKKIQLGERSFSIGHPDAELSFSFYCGNGKIKHEAVISFKNSNLLSSLIETGRLSYIDLAQINIAKLENLENQNCEFPYRYQIYNFKNCLNSYLLIFDINEYRDYYGYFIHGVLEIANIT